jgi:hypothetical protein
VLRALFFGAPQARFFFCYLAVFEGKIALLQGEIPIFFAPAAG